MLRKVKAADAVGMVLGHDLTGVIPGEWKGPVLRKGHVIRQEDVEVLLRTGNDYIWVLELEEGELHEDDAAERLASAAAGPGLVLDPPREGKVLIKAATKGLLKVRRELVEEVNLRGDLILSTLHDNTPCEEGMTVAATRVVPLVIREEEVLWAEEFLRERPALEIRPYLQKKVGVIVTGNEVYYGRVPDAFEQMVAPKIERYGGVLLYKALAPDDPEVISKEVVKAKEKGAEVILTTGGLSVDPGDVTAEGVRRTGAEVISYGSPVLPGAMFLYARLDGVPIMGLPACVFYHPTTIFDLLFPRVMVGEDLTREDIRRLGYGGLCLNCSRCRWPVCHFGRV